MGFGLCLEQRPVQPIGGRARQHPRHQLDRPLEEQPGGLTRGVAHDPPTRRIRRIAPDPRSPKRCGVDPRRVHVQAVEVDRTRLHRVERRACGASSQRLASHPCPSTHPCSGVASATRRTASARVTCAGQLHSTTPSAQSAKWVCPSTNPGSHQGSGELVAGESSRSLAHETRVRTDSLHLAAFPPDRVARGFWREGLYSPSPKDAAGVTHRGTGFHMLITAERANPACLIPVSKSRPLTS